MPILGSDIDPALLSAINQQSARTASGNAGTAVRTAAIQRLKQASRGLHWQLWLSGALMMFSPIAAALLQSRGDGPAILGLLFFQGIASVVGVVTAVQIQRRAANLLSPELLRGAASLQELSEGERAYCGALAALVEATPNLGEPAARELLAQLGDLLNHDRSLSELCRRNDQSATGSVAQLEAELAQLKSRTAAATDATSRSALEQSQLLCQQRLDQALRLEPARAQAEAQQSLILQTMMSVQGSLARSGKGMLASAATFTTSDDAHNSALADLSAAVSAVSNQARSVEEAVAEVVALR